MRYLIGLMLTLLIVPGVLAQQPKKEVGKEKATAVDIQEEAAKAQVGKEGALSAPLASEVELVERVAKNRRDYARSLKALKDFYMKQGNAYKILWVTTEMADLGKVQMFRYLDAGDLAPTPLKPAVRIPAADQLYKEGIHYKDYPEFPPAKKDKLKIAVKKFDTIIRRYPSSDKIDDAAFRLGEIYAGWYFEDYARAVKYYQRCWEWNANTEHPARFNAAKIYEEKLKNRAKAVEIYNKVIAESTNPHYVRQARDRIRAISKQK
ncbi:MAG: tetratricopeptide repeat protein [Phycisphaerae bacterium]|nr:tetratricopeptide repeat protein [Phycisphaerae bacterium]